MKKKLTYPLLILVALIWGHIVYRVVVGGITRPPILGKQVALVAAMDTPSVRRIVPALMLSYRDPFLADKPEKQASVTEGSQNGQPIVQAKIVWPEIHYLGFIQDASHQHGVFLLQIQGIECMMLPGDEKTGVRIRGGTDTTLLVSFASSQKVIHQQ